MSAYTYGVGYDLRAPLTLGGGMPSLEATVRKARESLAYYASAEVRGLRPEPRAEVTVHCAECDGDGLVTVGGAREMRKPLWARKTRECETCHGTGALYSVEVRP